MTDVHHEPPDAPRAADSTMEPGGHSHAGHADVFRRRFWWSLLLTVPVVVTSHMVMDWFGYELDFAGIDWVGPVLGTVIFFWGGWPFLDGRRGRDPGAAAGHDAADRDGDHASRTQRRSPRASDWFDLEFWWELAALVTIMLLGHWLEMKAIGQAQSALAALAELLPDEAERVDADGDVETVAARRRSSSATSCSCAPGGASPPTA